ncbi:MAG: Sua5/YciO/YrdC/YwlC family protein [Deltaproteobacteria bacterium]|nr:Sua5/YciO/YrdC/YwlC family protein [Deltaproteobacteria bacterium]
MSQDLLAAGDALARGGVAIYPTDTLYGLGGDATREEVVERILALKGLDRRRPFPLLVPSTAPALAAADPAWRPAIERLARVAWPGALTLVVPLAPEVRSRLAAACPDGTAGLRLPAHPAARYLAARAGGWLIGTSANPAGAAPPATAEAVSRALVAGVDVLVSSPCPCAGHASTILDLCPTVPAVLRAGDLDPGPLLRILAGDAR